MFLKFVRILKDPCRNLCKDLSTMICKDVCTIPLDSLEAVQGSLSLEPLVLFKEWDEYGFAIPSIRLYAIFYSFFRFMACSCDISANVQTKTDQRDPNFI